MNLKNLLFCLILLLTKFSFAQQINDEKLFQHVDNLLSKQFGKDEPGATVLISRKGQIIYKKAFGMANLELNIPMQVDNVFWIASIGKQFTAIAILQLMEQGKLSLQDEITKFIPDYPTQGNIITIEHLLTHTSGIHNYSGMKDPERKLTTDCTPTEVIDFFKNLPMRFAPGGKWEYSNSGYFLLGYIIEIISGKPYSEYIEENIFKPVGMTNSHFASNKRIIKNRVGAYSYGENGFENSRSLNMTHIYSAGAIQSTIEDFYKWHLAIHSNKLIKGEILDKAFSRFKLNGGQETDYGYGWKLGYIYDSPSIWHGGSIEGFGAIEIYLPKEDVFVVIFSNCDCNYPKDIGYRLAALAIGTPFEYKEIPVENANLSDYTGLYENQKGQQRIITEADNKLYAQLGRGMKSSLKAFEKDKFFYTDDPMQTIEFSRNAKNKIENLTSFKISGVEAWYKTNKALPDSNGIKVNEQILFTYVGDYEITPEMSFSVSMEKNKIFIQAGRQEKFEIFADTENKFFAKVTDAEFEFVKDDFGKVTKVILNQGGRLADAKKVK